MKYGQQSVVTSVGSREDLLVKKTGIIIVYDPRDTKLNSILKIIIEITINLNSRAF